MTARQFVYNHKAKFSICLSYFVSNSGRQIESIPYIALPNTNSSNFNWKKIIHGIIKDDII